VSCRKIVEKLVVEILERVAELRRGTGDGVSKRWWNEILNKECLIAILNDAPVHVLSIRP